MLGNGFSRSLCSVEIVSKGLKVVVLHKLLVYQGVMLFFNFYNMSEMFVYLIRRKSFPNFHRIQCEICRSKI